MRAREFITESKSSLFESKMANKEWMKPKYVQNLLVGLEEEQPYTFDVNGKAVTGIIQNPKEVAKNMTIATKNGTLTKAKIKVDIEVVDKESFEPTGEIISGIPINQMYKDEKILGFLKPNMGNVSEALLGCAVAARFMNGGKPITEERAIAVGKNLITNNNQLQTQAGKDKLYFKVSIPKMDHKAFKAWLGMDSRKKTLQDYKVSDETIALFDRRLKTAVDYANTSKRVTSAIQKAQEDPRDNKVDVISDGGEKANQNSTKVDLKILIDGQETVKRLLSVKAGDVAQFGQVAGVTFEHATEFFNSFNVMLSPGIRKYFYDVSKGTRDTTSLKQHNFENGMLAAYEDAAKKLKAKARSDQTGLVEDVYQGLLHHLTRKEEGVEMVILDPDDKKAFRELSFGPEFEQAMKQLQLVVTDNYTANSHVISIYGYPIGTIGKKFIPSGRKDASNKLLDLRSQFKDGTVRNMTAMGGLLKDIADIENYIEKTQNEPEVSKQPVAKAVPKKPVMPNQKPGTAVSQKTNTTQPIKSVGTQVKPALKVSQQQMGTQPTNTVK